MNVVDYTEARKDLKMWQHGMTSFPKSYTDYHEELAKRDLERLVLQYNITVYSVTLEKAGDFSGMKNLQAVIETRSHKLMKLTWHDSHSEGYWMKVYESGGAGMLFEDRELA
jgi:hypothetical protein